MKGRSFYARGHASLVIHLQEFLENRVFQPNFQLCMQERAATSVPIRGQKWCACPLRLTRINEGVEGGSLQGVLLHLWFVDLPTHQLLHVRREPALLQSRENLLLGRSPPAQSRPRPLHVYTCPGLPELATPVLRCAHA